MTWGGRRWPGWRERLPEVALGLLVLAGTLAFQFWPELQEGGLTIMVQQSLGVMHAVFPHTFLPVGKSAALSDIQPGYVLDLLLGLGLMAAAFRKSWELRLLVLGAVLLAFLYIPVPKVSPFLLSVVPAQVWGLSGTNLWFRFLPVLGPIGGFRRRFGPPVA